MIDVPEIHERTQVWSVDVSPDGSLLAIGTHPLGSRIDPAILGNDVYTLDSSSFEIVHTLHMPDDEFNSESVRFSPDGRILAVSHIDDGITLWDVETGEFIWGLLSSLDTPYHLMRFSPDGTVLAASRGDFNEGATEDQGVSIWSVQTGEELNFLRGQNGWVRGLDYSPDGTQIVSTSGDQTIIIRSIESPTARDWILANRYLPEFSCEDRERYNIQPLCSDGE